MVLAPQQKLKIKYELSYQSTTRLKYIDKFDQLLIIHQWTSTIDNYCFLCHVNRIHTCNTINMLIGHLLFNDDFFNFFL
jgi:hypothetical protein